MTSDGSLNIAKSLLAVQSRPQPDAQARPYSRRPDLLRLQPGVYVPRVTWREWDDEARHLARLHAALRVRHQPAVVAYETAAVVWGYPRIGATSAIVHLIAEPCSGAHNGPGVRMHRDRLAEQDVCEHRGLRVTSPARTLIDLARTAPVAESLCALDAALRRGQEKSGGVVKDDLLRQLDASPTRRGTARAAWVIEFSDGGAANPGESWSRMRIAELGFAPPQLQTRHPNPLGGYYYTDFEWPEAGVIGEFDGKGKYLKAEYLGSLSPGEAVYREKRREDHLRTEVRAFVRWGWPELEHPDRLESLLAGAGVRRPGRVPR